MINKENFYKVADAIEKSNSTPNPPMRFKMDNFVSETSCGTFACIAGYAWSLKDGAAHKKYANFFEEGREFLSLTEGEAVSLFYAENVDEDYGYGPMNDNANLVPSILRSMADTGIIDWKYHLHNHNVDLESYKKLQDEGDPEND